MARIDIREARSAAELEQAQAIRRAVFVAEQGVAEALEIDGRDATARHLLALWDGDPVGTLRLRWLDGGRTAKIERVAVLAAARGQKVGQALIGAALDLARAEGAGEARLHAQTTVQAFYAGLGFTAFGPEFEVARRRPAACSARFSSGSSASGHRCSIPRSPIAGSARRTSLFCHQFLA